MALLLLSPHSLPLLPPSLVRSYTLLAHICVARYWWSAPASEARIMAKTTSRGGCQLTCCSVLCYIALYQALVSTSICVVGYCSPGLLQHVHTHTHTSSVGWLAAKQKLCSKQDTELPQGPGCSVVLSQNHAAHSSAILHVSSHLVYGQIQRCTGLESPGHLVQRVCCWEQRGQRHIMALEQVCDTGVVGIAEHSSFVFWLSS